MSNQLNGASRTFVIVDDENRVRDFYDIAAGAVSHQFRACRLLQILR